MKNVIVPIILCGGKGSRLWPLSRQSFPKQFLSLYGNKDNSLLQQTQKRLFNLKNIEDPILICNEEHRFIVAEQMRSMGINPKAIILEPIGRNTAPAITLAALKAQEIHTNPTLLVLSADHKIDNDIKFVKAIEAGIIKAKNGYLVTFGVTPTHPETGYGYIESQKLLNDKNLDGGKIIRFIEKPNKKLAENLYEDRKYSCNSGIFVFQTNLYLQEVENFSPLILKICQKALSESTKDLDFIRIKYEIFAKLPDISIDVAIMEKTTYGAVIPINVGWSVIVNWRSLW